jgi:hypothetical protein
MFFSCCTSKVFPDWGPNPGIFSLFLIIYSHFTAKKILAIILKLLTFACCSSKVFPDWGPNPGYFSLFLFIYSHFNAKRFLWPVLR